MISEKIKAILITKNLTPSRFADEIGVQRSSISHILSGRNKPSLDIVQKIIRRFPDLGTEWLLEDTTVVKPTGEGRFPATISISGLDEPEPPTAPKAVNGQEPASVASAARSDKRVVKILLFYSDHTFTEYFPAGE